MSTRSNIAIILKEEDKARVFAKLNKRLEESGDRFRYGMDNGNVLQIYCHYDGYLNGVGKELLNSFNSYDEALKLILKGDASYIEKGRSKHYVGLGGDWRSNRPEQKTEPRRHEDYLYVFKDGNWKIPVNDEIIDKKYIDKDGYCVLKDYFDFGYN